MRIKGDSFPLVLIWVTGGGTIYSVELSQNIWESTHQGKYTLPRLRKSCELPASYGRIDSSLKNGCFFLSFHHELTLQNPAFERANK